MGKTFPKLGFKISLYNKGGIVDLINNFPGYKPQLYVQKYVPNGGF